MLALESPAPLWQTLELARDVDASLKPIHRRAFMQQLLRSDTVAFREGAVLVATAGFTPLPPEIMGEELAEIWFVCTPALGRHLTAFVRLARLTCGRVAQDGSVRIRAFVREGHAPGRRLAALCGLAPVAAHDGFERWEWRSGEVRQAALRRQVDGREERHDRGQSGRDRQPGSPADRGQPAGSGAGPGPGAA